MRIKHLPFGCGHRPRQELCVSVAIIFDIQYFMLRSILNYLSSSSFNDLLTPPASIRQKYTPLAAGKP